MRFLAGLILLPGFLSPSPGDDPLLVEAEGFEDYGGWVLDPQFMHLMGSAILVPPMSMPTARRLSMLGA